MKEMLLREIARLHKGITVWEFSQSFGKMSEYALLRYVVLTKRVRAQFGEEVSQ
jgi:hypothetical protein